MRSSILSRTMRWVVGGLLGLTSLMVAGADVVPKVHEKQAQVAVARQADANSESASSDIEGRRLIAMANTMFIFNDSPANRPPAEQWASTAVTSTSADDNANWPRPGQWSGSLATVLLGAFFVFRRIR